MALIRGFVYYLPPFSTSLDDPDRHPHALLTGQAVATQMTLVYGSTSDGPRIQGAACYPVVAATHQPADVRRLPRDTYFYGGILARTARTALSNHAADVRACMKEIDAAVREAIGYATGAAYSQPRGMYSVRGQIVEFQSQHADEMTTRFGVILTEHRYSQKRHYQVLVPLIDATDRDVGGNVPMFTDRGWIKPLFGSACSGVAAPGRLVHSVRHEKRIRDETRYALNATDLTAIERDVCDWLQVS